MGVAFTRRASISPPREPSRVPRSFGRAASAFIHLHAAWATARPKHLGSRCATKPLTAPAPGGDRAYRVKPTRWDATAEQEEER